jgi:cytochrome c-type biogenesis protein CcmH/NrfG
VTGEALKRKQVLNRRKIKPETPQVESPDVFAAMGTTLKTSGERLHVALLIALLAACAANLLLVCSWLQSLIQPS